MKLEYLHSTTHDHEINEFKEQLPFFNQSKAKKKSSLRIFWGLLPTFNLSNNEFMRTSQVFDFNSFLSISHTTLSTHRSQNK